LSAVLGLVIWEIVGRASSDFVFASFTASMAALWELTRTGVLLEHVGVTMSELAIGFSIGALIGFVGGMLAGLNRMFREMTNGWVTISLSTPFPAIFPIFVVWFGLGIQSKIALAVFAGFVPVWFNTRAGIVAVDPRLAEMTRAFGGKWWMVMRSVLLPGGMPAVMEGLRMGLGRAFIAVIVGELLASRSGLGYLINLSGQTLRMDQLLATVVVVAAITIALSAFMDRIQSLLVVRWWDERHLAR
jgi:ABC-type nitrate/sulfonate/bicarbonate transport system permease component